MGAPKFVSFRKGSTMGHDQLFKTLMEKFFRDFLELFFPAVAERLDFGTLAFLDKELFADFPQGPTREVDVVARLETREGEPEIVLVHVEVQSRPEKDFARRMFEYSVLLWLRHRVPIFPVVLYLQGGEGLTDEEYQVSLFGRELFRFRYASVGLARLRTEEYVETGPLGVALAVLMARRTDVDPVVLEADMQRRVAKSGLDDLRKFLLLNVIETYSKLSEDERVRLERLISRKEYQSVQEVKETWSDRMLKKGREEGREAGVIEGKRETLLRLLTVKFGPLSPETMAKLNAVPSAAELDAYVERIVAAKSLEDVGL
ncbi:MAG TPA: Rpn family recombination-promoting nuclease/putative transposase [Vicinamibacteria bacterium]